MMTNKYFLILAILSLTQYSYCQYVLWGGTQNGGRDNAGTIFYINPITEEITKVHEFSNTTPGLNPVYTRLTAGPNNTLWGVTSEGGNFGKGLIFEWNPDSNLYIIKHHFDDNSGANPLGSLLFYNNNFYGMTSKGGNHNKGVIFEYSTSNNTYLKKYDFDSINGSFPNGSFIEYSGLLYAMTTYGGQNNLGLIFSWNPTSEIQNILFEFDGVNGSNPYGDLTFHNGSLYGLTKNADLIRTPPFSAGIIFHWDLSNSILVKDWEFPAVDYSYTNGFQFHCPLGCNPQGTLLSYNGKLYGNATNGGQDDSTFYVGYNEILKGSGVLFEWNTDSSVYTVKKTFYNHLSINDETAHPQGALTAFNGKIYGILSGSGDNYWQTPNHFVKKPGSFYEWDTQNDSITLSANLGGSAYGSFTDGPINAPIVLNGRIYAITQNQIIEWNTTSNVLITHRKFSQFKEGKNISNSLAYYNGKLYGLTPQGGDNNTGILFEYNISQNKFYKLLDFYDYGTPRGELTIYNNKLYGLLPVFNYFLLYGAPHIGYQYLEWDPIQSNHNIFPGIIGREIINYSPTLYNNRLYNINSWLNSSNVSIASFDLATENKTEYPLSFPRNNIYVPNKLTPYKFKLYGLSVYDGAYNQGTLFEINPHNGQTNILYNFNCSLDACGPKGSVEIVDGIFYGLCSSGGIHGNGVLFAYDKANSTMQLLHHFDGTDGAEPNGQLLYYNGKLYGMTSKGGSHDLGVIFIWDIQNHSFRKIANFDGENGALPNYGKLTPAPLYPTAIRAVSDENEKIELHLYPIPTRDLLNINWENEFTGKILLEIFTASGKKISSETDYKKSPTYTKTLILNNLENGTYYFTIRYEKQSIYKDFILIKSN